MLDLGSLAPLLSALRQPGDVSAVAGAVAVHSMRSVLRSGGHVPDTFCYARPIGALEGLGNHIYSLPEGLQRAVELFVLTAASQASQVCAHVMMIRTPTAAPAAVYVCTRVLRTWRVIIPLDIQINTYAAMLPSSHDTAAAMSLGRVAQGCAASPRGTAAQQLQATAGAHLLSVTAAACYCCCLPLPALAAPAWSQLPSYLCPLGHTHCCTPRHRRCCFAV